MTAARVWHDTATTIINSGQIPVPITDLVIELMQTIFTEEQAVFVKDFKKPMRLEEVYQNYDLDNGEVDRMLHELQTIGAVTGLMSEKLGEPIYRVMPLLPGLFEYTLMRGETAEREKRLATLFDRLFGEMADLVQAHYDDVVPIFEKVPPMTRVVPVNASVETGDQIAMPSEDAAAIVDQFSVVAVSTCYCRHEKDLLGKPCKVTDERKNCLLFGNTAQFAIDYKFGHEITKDQAKEILLKAKDEGLVHKTFHRAQDIAKEEFAICNCCKCCCGTFELYYRGAAPAHHHTAYLAKVEEESCVGCEMCIEACPMDALAMAGDVAVVDNERCIGCGVCTVACETDAISLERTGPRKAYIAPERKSIS